MCQIGNRREKERKKKGTKNIPARASQILKFAQIRCLTKKPCLLRVITENVRQLAEKSSAQRALCGELPRDWRFSFEPSISLLPPQTASCRDAVCPTSLSPPGVAVVRFL